MSTIDDGSEMPLSKMTFAPPKRILKGRGFPIIHHYKLIKDDYQYEKNDNYLNNFLDRVDSMKSDAQYKMCGVVSHFARKDVTDRENHFLHLLNEICDSHKKWPTLIMVENVNKSCSFLMKQFKGELGYQVLVYVTMVLEKVNEGEQE